LDAGLVKDAEGDCQVLQVACKGDIKRAEICSLLPTEFQEHDCANVSVGREHVVVDDDVDRMAPSRHRVIKLLITTDMMCISSSSPAQDNASTHLVIIKLRYKHDALSL